MSTVRSNLPHHPSNEFNHFPLCDQKSLYCSFQMVHDTFAAADRRPKKFQRPDFSSVLKFQAFFFPLLHVCFSEKCYETTHLHYYEAGESWGRIHLRNVEQCMCAAGEIKCERARYTSKIQCFIDLNELEN